MNLVPSAAVTLALLLSQAHAALVSFDFTGTNPGENLPWTTTAELAPHVVLSTGFSRTSAPEINDQPGDDFVHFSLNGPGGVDTEIAWALTNDVYYYVWIAPADEYYFDLRDALVMADLERYTEGHGPRQIAISSSIEGTNVMLAISPQASKWSLPSTVTASNTLPNTATYNGVSDAVEFRYYLFGNQYNSKPGGIDNVRIGGQVLPIPEPSAALAAIFALLAAVRTIGNR